MNFDFLTGSIGKTVQLERGGPDKVQGELVDVCSDYLVLRTEAHGVLYCASHHVKTLTERTELRPEASEDSNEPPSDAQEAQEPMGEAQEPPGKAEQGEESDRSHLDRRIPVVKAASFSELLTSMKHRLVQVNHSGPNALKGVVMDVGSDSITVLHDIKEYVHYPLFHIRSVSLIYDVGDSNQGNDRDSRDRTGSNDSEKSQENAQDVGGKENDKDPEKKSEKKKEESKSKGRTASGISTRMAANTSAPKTFVSGHGQYGGYLGNSRHRRARRHQGA